MDNIESWKKSFLQKSMVVCPDSFPFMVLGNKNDLETKRQVSKEEAEQIVNNIGDGIGHMETSAKDCVNVEDAFTELARKALLR